MQFFLWSPFLLAVIFMLPRLLSPQFGLLDDGLMLQTTAKMAQGNWQMWDIQRAGRFRPIYWLYLTGVSILGGMKPLDFFLANTIVLLLILFLTRIILTKLGCTQWMVWVSLVLFLTSIPVIENFFTLSKGEPLQLLFSLLAVAIVLDLDGRKKHPGRTLRIGAAAIFSAFSIATKETGLVQLLIAIAWYVLDLFASRRGRAVLEQSWLKSYVMAVFFGTVFYSIANLWMVGSSQFSSGYSSTFTSIQLSGIVHNAIRWTGWILQDFPYLFPIIVGFAVSYYRGHRLPHVLMGASVWMCGWIAVLLPWKFARSYYLLPFALGVAVFSGWVLTAELGNQWYRQGLGRILKVLIMASFLLLVTITLINGYSDARIQLLVDRQNRAILDTVAEELGQDSRLYVNIQDRNELVDEIATQLVVVYGREDILFNHIQGDSHVSHDDRAGTFIMVPIVQNQPMLTVRMGVLEMYVDRWNEDLSQMVDQIADQELAFHAGSIILNRLEIPRILCRWTPTLTYCDNTAPLIDRRTFQYGWRLLAVE